MEALVVAIVLIVIVALALFFLDQVDARIARPGKLIVIAGALLYMIWYAFTSGVIPSP